MVFVPASSAHPKNPADAFARKLSTFEAIDTKTATVLVKTESRLFLPATIAENGRCIRARFGGQDLNFQSFVWT
jgi:hypothetical protein